MEMFEDLVHQGFIEQEFAFSGVYRYLDRYKHQDVETASGMDTRKRKDIPQDHVIWMFWKQGMDRAPGLVQKCYGSVCRNKPQDLEVILISDSDVGSYVDLPDYIWDKYEKGYITTTHLSDILRSELLCTYGGCWIDATVFCSGPIPWYMLSGDMFVFKLPSVLSDPVLKLSSWWIHASHSNRLMHLTRQMLYGYWKEETDIRSYFLLHIIMSKLIDEDAQCRRIFQRIPYSNSGNAHVLQGKLGEKFDEEEWRIIKSISSVQKLTYKRKYLQGDIYNYYTALLEGGLDQTDMA